MKKIIDTLNNFGLTVNDLVVNGNIQRCHSNSKDKNNKDGWYVVNAFKKDFYCSYGCWITGKKGKVTTAEITNKEGWVKKKKIAINADIIIKKCSPAWPEHPYLIQKKIKPHGILQYKNILIIPIQTFENKIIGYQSIDIRGHKKFMRGMSLKGCFYMIEGDLNSPVCICEGFATGCTINEATGYQVIISLGSANMINVAEQFKKHEIILCCDNDWDKQKNTGIETGKTIKKKFGCRMVWPEKIQGSDFNDMAIEKNFNAVSKIIKNHIKIITITDIQKKNEQLKILPSAIPEGLIREGVEAFGDTILQYTLPLVLTVIARSVAGKINLDDEHPNVFNIKVGGTSTGKSYVDKLFKNNLNIKRFVNMTAIASGPALLRGMQTIPNGLGMFDEATSLFTHYSDKDPIRDGKVDILLEVYSASGSFIKKIYADGKNTIIVKNPCFSLIGNATPAIFQAIAPHDFESGLMQRFNFWMYSGNIKKYRESNLKKINNFIEKLNKIMDLKSPASKLGSILTPSFKLHKKADAFDRLDNYSNYIIKSVNKEDNEGRKGILSRKYELALKYAMIHHAACNLNLYSDITIDDIDYGIGIADMLVDWKLNILNHRIVSGDFHRDCEIFKSAIISAIKNKRKNPTFKIMASRRMEMKNWNKKYSTSIINVLITRQEIVTKEINGITRYYLIK